MAVCFLSDMPPFLGRKPCPGERHFGKVRCWKKGVGVIPSPSAGYFHLINSNKLSGLQRIKRLYILCQLIFLKDQMERETEREREKAIEEGMLELVNGLTV